ncbi:hypothetical protein N644_2218 [Lactiplantibacillus paraplantarum]|nr:hypothetical protein N644_2218 [Lactiplantibacillus paraplantarum]
MPIARVAFGTIIKVLLGLPIGSLALSEDSSTDSSSHQVYYKKALDL